MARRISLNITNVHTSNDGTPLRATRSSTRKQGLLMVKSTSIDLGEAPVVKTTGTVGTRMVTRGRKVSLSPVIQTPSPAKNTRSHAKAALALSQSIQSPNSFHKKRRATVDTKTVNAPQKKKTKRPVTGRWEQWEHIEFLKGLREKGRGNWKVIAESIPTR